MIRCCLSDRSFAIVEEISNYKSFLTLALNIVSVLF